MLRKTNKRVEKIFNETEWNKQINKETDYDISKYIVNYGYFWRWIYNI
jgi:hypothetical protein